ncbi:DegT/DnrJ/EryC1/StrS family aminotransferase [Pseudoalteromonas ardens]|uniref:Aminotransferase DegT n=1 Tax=Pseudoalteromonas rubra TaxID=43658 RepID=A0A0L0ER24_9GAMM|nr:DegT/DnrJ/EryC1/StrS family aminotransferase [Pseudoalteromonas sp. R96]KNC66825.1 hypothetical protein AC626_14540 [Pseudoalteromonas rubra]MDK1309842.1 DegT/DnrJ/EryC1/StrS family aminotransferase [Pseudoalteromonas sp. R96]
MVDIKFIDLGEQRKVISEAVTRNVLNTIERLDFIGGEYVKELERSLCEFSGSQFSASCGSGTDALVISLMALDLNKGDKVICPSYTFTATAEAIVLAGGIPVFIDVDKNGFNLCPSALESYLKLHKDVRGVISVDIFGNPCDYDEIRRICDEFGIFYISDAAQSFGSRYKNRSSVTIADVSTTSFYPAKPLGCYGDGGALLTNDEVLLNRIVSLRNHGQGESRYIYNEIGVCSRLDTIQAGVLLAKLSIFAQELTRREQVARLYHSMLSDKLICQNIANWSQSSWAQFTVRLNTGINDTEKLVACRDDIVSRISQTGIPVQVYYGLALHLQPPYIDFEKGDLSNTEFLSSSTFSLPMHPYLTDEQVRYICEQVNGVLHDYSI